MNTKVKQTQVGTVMRIRSDRTKIFIIGDRNRDVPEKNPQPTFRKGDSEGRFTGIYLTGEDVGKLLKEHVDIHNVEILAASAEDLVSGRGFPIPLTWNGTEWV
jgi:hypothetical protein